MELAKLLAISVTLLGLLQISVPLFLHIKRRMINPAKLGDCKNGRN